jgi:hypothetical protein
MGATNRQQQPINESKRSMLKATTGMLPIGSAAGVLYLAYHAFCYLFFPQQSDAPAIYDFCVLIGFEFILVCANIFLGMFAQRSTILFWFLSLLFFLPFFYCFTLFIIDVSVMKGIIICMIISHLVDMFTLTQDEGMKVTGYYALRTMLYFFVLMGCVMASDFMPAFGLSDAYLTASNYSGIKRHGGIILDQPNVGVMIGLLYYGILSLGKVYGTLNKVFHFNLGSKLAARLDAKTATLKQRN